MNKSAEKSARLEEVVRRLAVNIELFSQVERYYKMFVNSYRDLVEVLRRLKLLELVDFYKKYKNCSIEETWVLNKQKKKYYYYYLKCKKGGPRSIYLGRSLGSYSTLRQVSKRAFELKQLIDRVGELLIEFEKELLLYMKYLKQLREV
ncbi:MAG: hypothetical protein LM567_03530 [Desulfurococcaceae archaeon]|jgi:hypothetical protein|nr:hypothetical protein [Desulfurococcaceae archaeon]